MAISSDKADGGDVSNFDRLLSSGAYRNTIHRPSDGTQPPDVYDTLHQTALQAPSSSGVYLWRNAQSVVIYVGKAKSLRNRLRSYFSGRQSIKTRTLISRAVSIEYITTSNEYEAFLLENNLIKQYSPRYNIDLKDGKSYPSLRLTHEKFPRLFKTRNIIHDGSSYFGPYPDAGALDTFLDALSHIYPLRHCKTLKKRTAPCLYHAMERCSAPCCGRISEKSYNEYIGEIAALLEGESRLDCLDTIFVQGSGAGGRQKSLGNRVSTKPHIGESSNYSTTLTSANDGISRIEREMRQAAKDLNFEKAARMRDALRALKIMQSQNVVESFDGDDRDYIDCWRQGELVSVTVLRIRRGKLGVPATFRTVSLAEDNELAAEFMGAYYTDKDKVPPTVYIAGSRLDTPPQQYAGRRHSTTLASNAQPPVAECSEHSEECTETTDTDDGTVHISPDDITRWLCDTLGAATHVVPVTEEKGTHAASILMARENAREDIIRRVRERGDSAAMEELKKLLDLSTPPHHIEGFDIAHIDGKFPVASMVYFIDGQADKKNYRYFRLKTTDRIIDDFASMREATSRRYTRLMNENQPLPDLVLIDGGIGQVNAVWGVLDALGLDIPVVGLAKRDEEIWLPHAKGPISLPRRSDALRMLQRVRDEAHRFATSRNQALRTKENTGKAAT